jgi:hypothetical protein
VARDRYLLFPLLTPAALLAARNDGFGFDAPGFVDPFAYLGNFWHYAEHLPRFDSDYKISRLPWVLPGFVAHALGGEILGAYLLNYATMAAAAVALYLLLRDALGDRPTASVIAVAWACCTQAHGVGGWNYHMGAAGAYYLAACWLVVRAARSPALQGPPILAGVLLACAVHTHVFLVAFFPLIALLYWSAVSAPPVRPLAQTVHHVLLLVAGALGVTFVLAAINGLSGGKWLFFQNQITYTLREAQSGSNPWWIADPLQWAPTAMHLVIPTLFMLAGLGLLTRASNQQPSRLRIGFVVQAWAAFAILTFFQFARRLPMLDHDYFAFVVYFHAFPCAAAALLSDGTAERQHSRGTMAGIAAIVMIGTLMLLMPTALPSALGAVSTAIVRADFPPVAGPLIAGVVGIVAMLRFTGPPRLVAFAVWFSVVNVWVAPTRIDYGIGTPGSKQSMAVLFRQADRFTADLDPTLSGIKYWWIDESLPTPEGPFELNYAFDSFVATRGWMASLFGGESPLLPVDRLAVEHLRATTCFGVLSSTAKHDELTRTLSHHFETLGHPLAVVASRLFRHESISFELTVFKPLSATETLPPCWPV